MLSAECGSSPRHSFRLTVARRPQAAGPAAGGWFAHSFQQIFQNHRVVLLLILGCEKQRQLFWLIGETVEFIERLGGFGARQLLKITLSETRPCFGTSVKPLS